MPQVSINEQKILYRKEGNRITFWGKALPEKSVFIVEEKHARFHYPLPPGKHFIQTIEPQLESFFKSLYHF